MRVLILTNSVNSKNGWSYLGTNLINNLKIFQPSIYSYSDNKIISHNLRLHNLNILTPFIVLFDFIFVSLKIKKIPDIAHAQDKRGIIIFVIGYAG